MMPFSMGIGLWVPLLWSAPVLLLLFTYQFIPRDPSKRIFRLTSHFGNIIGFRRWKEARWNGNSWKDLFLSPFFHFKSVRGSRSMKKQSERQGKKLIFVLQFRTELLWLLLARRICGGPRISQYHSFLAGSCCFFMIFSFFLVVSSSFACSLGHYLLVGFYLWVLESEGLYRAVVCLMTKILKDLALKTQFFRKSSHYVKQEVRAGSRKYPIVCSSPS